MDELSPLPRSLDPLPDEVLPGYLLRLAHRLDRTPARILQLTGLAGRQFSFPCRSSYEPMIGLDEQARAVFTAVTRLTGTEADSLCLQSLAARYPFPSWLAGSRKLTLRTDMWVFATATRYCPRCLAGDGTPSSRPTAGPGSVRGGCPSSSPAPATGGSWNTCVPSASVPRSAHPPEPAASRSCRR